MIKTEYGVRLTDVREEQGWTVDVPACSLAHAEEVVRWHSDPTNESCYQAAVLQQVVITTNWQLHQ